MFDTNLIFALISFYFVMYVTPGPNNAMVLASGLKFGFLKSIPHMTGITIGHVTQLILVCLGLGKIFQIFPELQNILKILCAIYLIYLGYKIIGGKLDKCLMFGDSENDADAARAANIPMILLEDGYTDKKIEQIYHNHLISDFVNVEKIVSKYLNG